MTDTSSSCSSWPGMDVYRLRAVIAGISPLIWRRLEAAAGTMVAGLHAIVQAVFGWSGEHLHRFVIGGTEYGISYIGGPASATTPGRLAWPTWACARASGSPTSTTSSLPGA